MGSIKIWLLFFVLFIIACTKVPTGFVIAEKSKIDELVRANSKMSALIQEGYSFEISIYSSEELAELAKKYPVIYSGLEEGISAVQFNKGSSGRLFIYDAEDDEILREFNTQGINLG